MTSTDKDKFVLVAGFEPRNADASGNRFAYCATSTVNFCIQFTNMFDMNCFWGVSAPMAPPSMQPPMGGTLGRGPPQDGRPGLNNGLNEQIPKHSGRYFSLAMGSEVTYRTQWLLWLLLAPVVTYGLRCLLILWRG